MPHVLFFAKIIKNFKKSKKKENFYKKNEKASEIIT